MTKDTLETQLKSVSFMSQWVEKYKSRNFVIWKDFIKAAQNAKRQ